MTIQPVSPAMKVISALRSQFGETSEALFLTQGYVYDSAEQCEARFKGHEPGFIYSRYSNPTIDMFERRMIELEGAEVGGQLAAGVRAVTGGRHCHHARARRQAGARSCLQRLRRFRLPEATAVKTPPRSGLGWSRTHHRDWPN